MKQPLRKIALIVVFLVAVASQLPGPYYIYAWRESGSPSHGGPWIQYVGMANSPMGGNVIMTTSGTMILDNRTWYPTYSTTVDGAGNCTSGGMIVPCRLEN